MTRANVSICNLIEFKRKKKPKWTYFCLVFQIMIIENIRYDKCDLARSHVEVFFGMKAILGRDLLREDAAFEGFVFSILVGSTSSLVVSALSRSRAVLDCSIPQETDDDETWRCCCAPLLRSSRILLLLGYWEIFMTSLKRNWRKEKMQSLSFSFFLWIHSSILLVKLHSTVENKP